MLTIYNESKNRWRFKKLNDRVSKLSAMIKLDDTRKKFINILLSNDVAIDTEILPQIAEHGDCVKISDNKTAVKFQRKDLNPTIVAGNDQFNNDILIITVRLNGRIVRNINTSSAAILSHYIAKGNLVLVVSLRAIDNIYSFDFVLHDNKALVDTTYTFSRNINAAEYDLLIEDSNVTKDEMISEPTYKIYNFRQLRPTYTILVNKADEATFTKAYQYAKNNNVIYFDTVDELKTEIDSLIESKYKAVTLFVNRERTSQPIDTQITNTVKDNFRYVNFLFNTGKVTIVK